jgi:hypothetical protein
LQLYSRRGDLLGSSSWYPYIPNDRYQPVGGGIESRCGSRDRECGWFIGATPPVLPSYYGKRGVCIINGEIFGSGEDIPDEKLIVVGHPFGDTQNQPYLGDDSIGGGVELESAHPKTPYVPVILNHDVYPFTEDDYPDHGHSAAKAKYRNADWPQKEDWIVTGKRISQLDNFDPYRSSGTAAVLFAYNFGFIKLSMTKVT